MPEDARGKLLAKLAEIRPAQPLTPASLHDFVEERGVLLEALQTLTGPGTPAFSEQEQAWVAVAQQTDRDVMALAQVQLSQIGSKLRRASEKSESAGGRLVDRIG